MEINQSLDKTHYTYPSIEHYKNLIRNVKSYCQHVGKDSNEEPIYDHNILLPTLDFIGTVKMHGTNAAIVIDFLNNEIYFQSHNHIIIPTHDNAGFALYMASIQEQIFRYFHSFGDDWSKIIIYGEWCGGNIQSGVGLSQLEKMFVIFDIKMIDYENNEVKESWCIYNIIRQYSFPELRIYNIYDTNLFPHYLISIDFNNPQESQNKLISFTESVENECPVAKAFGIENSCGEGIVYKCINNGFYSSRFWMKVKGTKRSTSHVKTLVALDPEKFKGINEFVENVVTENRLWQSIAQLKEDHKPVNRTSLGNFLNWIKADIIKEETDTIVANLFDPKLLWKPVSEKARIWFFNNEINFVNT